MEQVYRHIEERGRSLEKDIIAVRREFHRNPELSGEERWATERLKELLGAAGARIMPLDLATGVVAELGDPKSGPTVALRADIDALPIQEETEASYASRVPGKMHACGHDSHIASMVGAAMILSGLKDLPGTVRLIFQPAEETVRGARQIIEAGGMQGVDAIFALHSKPDLPVGVLGVKEGPLMAAAGLFRACVRGRGGHGALPHQTRDPVVAAAATVLAWQSIVARNVNPLDSAVLSVGTIRGGQADNVVPERVELSGTMRAFSPEAQDLLLTRMRETAELTTGAYGCEVEFPTLSFSTSPVVNDGRAVELARAGVAATLGEAALCPAVPVMASEDFCFYQELAAGCLLWLGAGKKEGETAHPWHHPKFDIDEGCLAIGASALAGVALHALRNI